MNNENPEVIMNWHWEEFDLYEVDEIIPYNLLDAE